jgi:hypothetical protein
VRVAAPDRAPATPTEARCADGAPPARAEPQEPAVPTPLVSYILIGVLFAVAVTLAVAVRRERRRRRVAPRGRYRYVE